MCTQTFTSTEIDPLLRVSGVVVLQSVCNGSTISSDRGWVDSIQNLVFLVLKFVLPKLLILLSLPFIDEVNSPEKDDDCSMSSKVGVQVELQELIWKLKEEDAESERI